MRFHLLALSTSGLLLVSACTTPSAGGAKGEHAQMDMAQMCAMHRQMMEGKSPAEQQAAIEAQIKAMHGTASPEMVEMHRKMMDSQCGGPGAVPGTK